MALKRMDNVLIVVEDLEAVKAFFIALGLELEGEATVEGPMVGQLIGLENVKATLAMLRPPNGQGGIELDKFHTPDPVRHGPVNLPVNALGIRRIMFAVEDIGETLATLRERGVEVIGEMQYGESYRLAYIRGPEGIIVGLAQEVGAPAPKRRTASGAKRKAVAKTAPGKRRAPKRRAAKRKPEPKPKPKRKPAGRKKAARE
jgi:catechol 2,3-dioxygenase-like lactoylglutathione lyase family enzyme